MSKRRIGGVSYFTEAELRQLKYDDNHLDDILPEPAKMKKDPVGYGKILAAAREKRGISRKELDTMLGYSRGTVWRWEIESGRFPWEKVEKVLPEIGPKPKGYTQRKR